MSDLLVERSGGVVRARLNRQATKNAMNFALIDALVELCHDVDANDHDRALVLLGAGGDFSTGIDLSDPVVRDRTWATPLEKMQRFHSAALALHELRKPSIAAVDGYAVGAGMSLALCCDLVVASSRARFSAIFVKRGLSIDFGLSWLLPRIVGTSRAKEIALLGDIVDADTALALGIACEVVAPEDLDAAADRLAARLAGGPTVAMGRDLELIDRSFERSFAEALDAEAESQVANQRTEDVTEAVTAFLEKREPRFKGR